jgi:hypothetical protein
MAGMGKQRPQQQRGRGRQQGLLARRGLWQRVVMERQQQQQQQYPRGLMVGRQQQGMLKE